MELKVNTIIICKKSEINGFRKSLFIKGEKYEIKKIENNMISVTNEPYKIFYHHSGYTILSLKDFERYFLTNKELRKLKIKKLMNDT